MSRHARLTAAILAVLFALTAIGAFAVYAEDGGDNSGGSGYSDQQEDPGPQPGGDDYDEPQPGGGDDDEPQPGGDDDDEPQPGGDNSGDDQPGGGGSSQNDDDDDDDDDDDSHSGGSGGGSSSGGSSSSSFTDEYVFYDSNGNGYSSSDDMYVGGNQTYVPPASVPSTTAALYDTSKSRIDDRTLTSSDWNDIARKLREPANSGKNTDVNGDFAFIQKNSETADNGHWMLLVGFSLIALSIVGFIFLIVNASKNKKRALADSYRPASNAYAQRAANYSDDYREEPRRKKKNADSGRRYK